MAIELAEVAAGFPLAASLALAGGISALREGRRRSALNEAMHELRRPLQVLALSLPGDSAAAERLDSSLRMAVAAADRLDREINGGSPPDLMVQVSARGLVEATVRRWQPRAALEGRPLGLCWQIGNPLLHGDEVELEQAVDNLISNAFEHGSGEIVVEARERDGGLCLQVRDAGTAPARSSRGSAEPRARIGGRGRHGHGLRIVRRAAARHGGSFQLRRTSQGTEARLRLPVAGDPG